MSQSDLEYAITKYLWERIHAADEELCRRWAKGIVSLIEGANEAGR